MGALGIWEIHWGDVRGVWRERGAGDETTDRMEDLTSIAVRRSMGSSQAQT